MTDQQHDETTPPTSEPFADEPIPETDTGSAAGKGREWLAQLEAMINDIATQAAPVARQVAAKAAELTAAAAVKAGPIAQRAAEVTTDAGHKLAERAQNLAAELRGEPQADRANDAPPTPVEPATATNDNEPATATNDNEPATATNDNEPATNDNERAAGGSF